MTQVLVISQQVDEIISVLLALPQPPIVIGVADLPAAQAYLQQDERQPFAIFLADGRGQSGQVEYWQQVHKLAEQDTAALIALLESPAERELVFQVGVSDYLLLPLQLDELVSHLRHYCLHHHLLTERNQLRQRALENERLVIIGRLTASIVHSISNPMQAMRGALTLAYEDSQSPRDVEEYIRLTQQELERVACQVDRMRQLYRPQSDTPVIVHLPDLLRDAFEIAHEEAMRQKVDLQDELTLDVPPIQGVKSQLQLAFLSVLLNLIDAVGAVGGGKVTVSAIGVKDKVHVDFAVPSGIEIDAGEVDDCNVSRHYLFSPMMDLITANQGCVDFLTQNEGMIWRVEFPKMG